MRVGLLWALAAVPFALAIAAGATQIGLVVQLFAGSKWFTFKAAFGVLELVVFGLVAAVTQQRIAARKSDARESAA